MNELKQFGANYRERTENAVRKLKEGKGIVLVDDEDRENEGDLIFPAESMAVADMALMIRECSGIVCLCLSPEKAAELRLNPMAKKNTSRHGTAFTISIEAKEGVTTGVSAEDRITTIRTAVAENAVPSDLVYPGHVFPLTTAKNGVFGRRGHTEGSVDIVRISGTGQYAVLCELMNPDGTMKRLPELTEFAGRCETVILTVEDIIRYRTEFGYTNPVSGV